MKKTDLEKNKALKLLGKMKQSATPGRYSAETSSPVVDRREQRRLDQAQGLVSFPVKIKQTIVEEIRQRAAAQETTTNEVIGALLEQALKNS